MHLHESNIRVADYITKLPDRKVLEQKLQQAVERAKMRIAQSKMEKGMPMYNDNTTVESDNADN